MTVQELDALAEMMTRRRVVKLKAGGVEMELSMLAFAVPDPMPTTQGIGAEAGNPTEEEMLFWSAPGPLPDLRARPPVEPTEGA